MVKFFFKTRVSIIAPHNDDEVIGCWFLMQELAGQADISVIVATSHARDPDLRARRQQETRTALARIGISNVEHWDIPDGSANAFVPQLQERLTSAAANHDYVLCPAPNDRTPDHVPIANAACEIIPVEKLIWYRSTWWTFTSENADFEVRGKFSDKKAALACFKSQKHVALLRSVFFSRIETLLTSGKLEPTEQFMFASKGKLSSAPLNSISLRHVLRLLVWR